MTTTETTPTTTPLAITPGASLLPWINRGLESLWLLAVFLVPLMFLSQDYVLSEARIGFVEVPKVAVLRTLAGLIVLLWATEWAIKGHAFRGPFPSISIDAIALKLNPSNVASAINKWLKVHPTRLLLLAAGLFFGSTLLSTVLSGSPTISLWGEIPGQDGYSAYTIASYGVLFGVIATHLKSQAQLGRLLGAVILMGTLVGLYGIFQHYGHDFLSITEESGGGSSRVTIFMGNTIFAAAVLAMTVPVTLVAAAVTIHIDDLGKIGPLARLEQWLRGSVFTSLWALILAVQILGLMFTFSRGPWGGAVLAMVVFLGLVVLSFGWRILIKTGLVLTLGGILVVGFLHWQGSVSIVNVGPWLGVFLALLGLAGTAATLFAISRFERSAVFIVAVGAVFAIVVAAVFAQPALSGRGGADSTNVDGGAGLAAGQLGERLSSVKTDVLSGFVGGRGTHWGVSWKLIKNRPWFDFDELHLTWLRPLIGYGPDLFRYTYLLESPAEDIGFLPLEPDHAHNFFIHQTVEQGILGGVASLALFASVFAIAAHHLIRRRITGPPIYRLLLFGLMAIILGRFLEMMVGVARISDLTVLWVLFGLFTALVTFDDNQPDAPDPVASPAIARPSRRNRRRAARASASTPVGGGLLIRLAVVAWLAGGVGVVTWQKNINNVRASVAEAAAFKHFEAGELESSIGDLDKAIRLAPGIPNYYNNRAQVFLAYQLRPEVLTEPGCKSQTETGYEQCLGLQSLLSTREAVKQQPFNFRARLAAGNSAFNLGRNEEAIEEYRKASSIVPNAWGIRNDLAESLIDVSRHDEALEELDRSLEITGQSIESTRAYYLKGRVFRETGSLDDSLTQTKIGLSLGYASESAQASLDLIQEINAERGVTFDLDYFNALLAQNPDDPVAYYNRGIAQLALGNYVEANDDIETAHSRGLVLDETRATRGYARFKVGNVGQADGILTQSLELAPRSALFNAYYGEIKMALGSYSLALNYLENANIIDPDLGLAYLIRSKIYLASGLEESANEVLQFSAGVLLDGAEDYADRGELYAYFGDYEKALADLNDAIRINPNKAGFYNARGTYYASMSDFESALGDFDTAIAIASAVSEYFVNRAVIQDLLGDTEQSLADFEVAQSLGAIDLPPPEARNVSYFAVNTSSGPAGDEARILVKLREETEALRDIEFYSAVPTDDPTYQSAMEALGKTYLDLELWEQATESLSRSIIFSPTSSLAFRYRADAYLALNRYDEAIEDYTNALRLDSFNSENFIARGRGHAEVGEYELARNDFDEAIRLDPDSSNAYSHRGFLSVQTGNHSMAFTDLDQAIEIFPLNHDAYFKRATAYTELGQTALALEDLEQAIKFAPTDAVYLYTRGLLHQELLDIDSAIRDFDGAIALQGGFAHVDPKYVMPFLDRGKVYLQLGNLDQAISDASTVIRLINANFRTQTWENHEQAIDLQMADAHEFLGDAYSRLGKLGEAQLNYRLASGLR